MLISSSLWPSRIISAAYDRYLLQFPEEKREQLKQKVKDQMIEEHGEALSSEQQKIIDIIFKYLHPTDA